MKQTSQFVNGIVQNGYKNNMHINKLVYVYTFTFPGCQYIIIPDIRNFRILDFSWPTSPNIAVK